MTEKLLEVRLKVVYKRMQNAYNNI
jgi:hypothetical protein